ncbi:MAG: molybdopterin-dependent oxidoreductase [Candidatus Edwardsbacteria bacterium]
MKNVLTICPYCGCGCGIYLLIDDGHIVGVTPSENHPVSKGSLCARGWTVYQFIEHPERIKQPLWRKDNSLLETNWETALNFVADRLQQVAKKYGSKSIGMVISPKSSNEEVSAAKKFAEEVLQTRNFDSGARLAMPAYSFSSSANFDDLEEADLIFVLGSNVTETAPILGKRIMAQAKRGKKLIVIDPRITAIAKFATIHLRPKVGSDYIWLSGLLKLLSKKYSLHPRDEKILQKITEQFVKEKTLISEEDSQQVANLICEAERTIILFGKGLTQQTDGLKNLKLLQDLLILLGNGAKILPVSNHSNERGVLQHFSQRGQGDSLSYLEMISAAEAGNIKALFLIGENPLLTLPNTNFVKKALENLDLLVVQDLFLTETGRMASVVLPNVSFAEKEGTVVNMESRSQKLQKAIEPLGEAKPDIEIIEMLAKKISIRNPQSAIRNPQSQPLTINHQLSTDYPFTLSLVSTYPHHFGSETMTMHTNLLRREIPEGFALIHPEDAKELGIKSGWNIRLISSTGELTVKVLLSETLPQKTIFIPFHFGANLLLNSNFDPETKIPAYKEGKVRVETIQ